MLCFVAVNWSPDKSPAVRKKYGIIFLMFYIKPTFVDILGAGIMLGEV